jgi:cytosine/adenosine deaminase-related metal-dependent hydrolase
MFIFFALNTSKYHRRMSKKTLIQNPIIVTMNPQMEVFRGDILIADDRIREIGQSISVDPAAIDQRIDASGFIVTPGFIHSHIHLCQALFRNLADDLSLLDWLSRRIWPLEARHTPETLRISARLGLAELIKSGATAILDMGAVHFQEVIFEELAASGMRAVSGNTLMDDQSLVLRASFKQNIDESLRLIEQWHNYDGGRIQFSVTPRFALSCSEELMQEAGRLAEQHQLILHTHASENRDEIRQIHQRFGCSNIQLFGQLNISAEHICLAHCVWPEEGDASFLKSRGIHVLHCPSANLKLGSGIAPVIEYLQNGINVALGADGAPCNNNLDIFMEMRLAALIQKPLHGPDALPAKEIVKMATLNGAKALGMEASIGSLEPGKKADLVFINNDQVHSIPYENVYSKLVYSVRANDVRKVMIDGKWVLVDGQLTTLDENEIINSVQNVISRFDIN